MRAPYRRFPRPSAAREPITATRFCATRPRRLAHLHRPCAGEAGEDYADKGIDAYHAKAKNLLVRADQLGGILGNRGFGRRSVFKTKKTWSCFIFLRSLFFRGWYCCSSERRRSSKRRDRLPPAHQRMPVTQGRRKHCHGNRFRRGASVRRRGQTWSPSGRVADPLGLAASISILETPARLGTL